MNKSITNGILLLTCITSFAVAAVPEQCIQLPTRTAVCPHLLYKKSPVDVVTPKTSKGEMVCICMDDFKELRIEAQSELDIIDQQVALKRAAEKLAISEADLLTLIRN